MVGPFAVDGYDVLAPFDAAAGRWRAICLGDGQPVVLRHRPGAGARLAGVRRRAALWGSVQDDVVVPVRDVLEFHGDLVIVSDACGDPLDLLLNRWGSLAPGQVVTLTVGLARGVAAAHARGLVHGRLDASSVLIDGDGRPRLTDYVWGDATDPAADVVALVALATRCLDGDAPPALVAALESPAGAADLADRVLTSVPALPLTSRTPLPVAVATSGQGNASGVRVAVGLTVAVAVLATAFGMWWQREPAASAPVAPRSRSVTQPSATPAPLSLGDEVRRLEHRRARALALADANELATVDVSGTPLWRQDSRDVAQLIATRSHLRGLRVRVIAVRVEGVQTTHATVRVIDALSSYDVVDARGRVVAHRPARPAQAVDLVLAQVGGQWRIRTARPVNR